LAIDEESWNHRGIIATLLNPGLDLTTYSQPSDSSLGALLMTPTAGHLKWPTRLLLIQWVKKKQKKGGSPAGEQWKSALKC